MASGGFPIKDSYTREELLNVALGKYPGMPKLPLQPMLMIDRIDLISAVGGLQNKGHVKATYEITESNWFFDSHFMDDPVMPGCLELDALWQLTGFFLGWKGARGNGRARGMGGVKLTGEILPSAKLVRYRVDIKQLRLTSRVPMIVSDAFVECDGKVVCTARDLHVMVVPFAAP